MKSLIYFLSFLCFFHVSRAQDRSNYDQLIEKAQSFEMSNPDSVLFYAELALQEENENQSDAFYWKGVGYRLKRELDSAAWYYQKALTTSKTEIQEANAYMGLGGINYSLRVWDEALNYFVEAAKLYEALDRPDRLGSAYSNIGIIMNSNDNDQKALFYFRESIKLFDEAGLDNKKLPSLVNIASLFNKNDQFDSAIFYAEQCYNISKQLEFKFGMSKALFTLAPAYIELGQAKKGYDLAVEGEKLFDELGIEESASLMRFNQAKALTQMGEVRKAFAICTDLQRSASDVLARERLYDLMSTIYEKLGDPTNALLYQRKFHLAYKEFITEEKATYLDELEKKYESERKENEIHALQSEMQLQALQSSQKNWVIAFLSVVGVLLMISLWLYYQKRLSKEKEQTAIHKQQLLRSQINPHFIFNALSSIRGFLFENKEPKEAITYLGKFAKLMRMVLDHSSKELVTLKEEIEALEIYLEIQKMRFNNGFNYSFNIDPAIDLDRIKVPPLLAQPFIENAIEHGFKNISYPGTVEFTCKSEGEQIRFSIVDNGIGIDHVQSENKHDPRALKIFRERMETLSKRLKESRSYFIKDLGNSSNASGTHIEYIVPTNLYA